MQRLIFLRHGTRPERPRSGVDKPDALTPFGEAQARAVGPLLAEHGLQPVLAIHTPTRRTHGTVVRALGAAPVPIRAVPRGPGSLTTLATAMGAWASESDAPGPILLCAHHTTQNMLCKALGLSIQKSARALIVVDLPLDRPSDARLVLAWSCAEDGTLWQPVLPT